MKNFDPEQPPSAWGSYEDSEALRRWSFNRRTPEQRLAWLAAALEIAYQSGALKPRRPAVQDSLANESRDPRPSDVTACLQQAPKVATVPDDDR